MHQEFTTLCVCMRVRVRVCACVQLLTQLTSFRHTYVLCVRMILNV
jgi:hypothetical protein